MRDQSVRQSFQRNDSIGIATLNGGAWHAENNRRSFILGNGERTGCLQRPRPSAPSSPMPVISRPTASAPNSCGNGAEQNIDGGAMAIDLDIVGEHDNISQGHAPDSHMAVSGAD